MTIIFLLTLLWAGTVLGQEKYIALKREPLEISNRNFYIKDVIDARANLNDVGFAQTGAFNRKVLVKFDAGVRNELLDYFSAALPPMADQTPVILKLLALKVGEKTGLFSEHGMAEAKMAFYVEKEGRLGKVFETEAFYKTPGKLDVTKFHEENLRKVIGQCLQNFASSDWETVSPVYENVMTEATDTTKVASWSLAASDTNSSALRHAQSTAAGAGRYKYFFGIGGLGGFQQDQIPMEFGTGVRLFFGSRDFRQLTFELGIDFLFERALADSGFLAFGNETTAFAFTRCRQVNLDLAAKIAFVNRPDNFPYLMMNFGATGFHATDGKALTISTLQVRDEKVSISGIYFGAGLGYKRYLSSRMFMDYNAVFDFVIINSATGGSDAGRLPKSIRSNAEILKVQLGYDF
jgi:hypothetical protein